MDTILTNEQKNKLGIQWKCLLKIPPAKNMLYWEKKDQLVHLIWKKTIELKALKLRYLIKKNIWECSAVHTWSATDIFFLKLWSPAFPIRQRSTKSAPSGSDNRKTAEKIELFPAPVLPTMPTCNEIQKGLRIKNMQQT